MPKDPFLNAAIEQARKSLAEGGIPIGSVLVHEGKIIGAGHNCRVQTGSPIDHGEMNCLRNAGRLPAAIYRNCTIYSTLSPCPMCSGAIVLYKIPSVVVGDLKFKFRRQNQKPGPGINPNPDPVDPTNNTLFCIILCNIVNGWARKTEKIEKK